VLQRRNVTPYRHPDAVALLTPRAAMTVGSVTDASPTRIGSESAWGAIARRHVGIVVASSCDSGAATRTCPSERSMKSRLWNMRSAISSRTNRSTPRFRAQPGRSVGQSREAAMRRHLPTKAALVVGAVLAALVILPII
jgi:hypothetical protein